MTTLIWMMITEGETLFTPQLSTLMVYLTGDSDKPVWTLDSLNRRHGPYYTQDHSSEEVPRGNTQDMGTQAKGGSPT